MLRAVLLWKRAEEFQALGEPTAHHVLVPAVLHLLHHSSEHQYAAVDDGDDGIVHPDGHHRTGHCPDGGGNFEHHAEADVGDAFFDVGRARTAGRGDGRHQRRPHRIVEIDAETEGEEGDDDHTAPQTGERTEQSRAVSPQKENKCKGKYRHIK